MSATTTQALFIAPLPDGADLGDGRHLPILSSWADITCGEPCWHAREDICRCSCGGKNHGCLRTANGIQPVRTCKIGGDRYELLAVGFYAELIEQARELNDAGWSMIDAAMPTHRYHYSWKESDDGAPARMKPATKDQQAKWPELAAYREREDKHIRSVYLLWKHTSPPALHFCPDACERCDKLRAKNA